MDETGVEPDEREGKGAFAAAVVRRGPSVIILLPLLMSDDANGSERFERFVALAKRELAAEDVSLLSNGEAPPEASNVVLSRLPDGRHVVATFAEPPKEPEVLARRLGILAGTFVDALSGSPSGHHRARPPAGSSLHEELKALIARARAADAVVIDVDSPVVWGSATVPARPRARNDLMLRELSQRELVSHPDGESGPLGDIVAPDESSTDATRSPSSTFANSIGTPEEDGATAADPEVTRRALQSLRENKVLASLHKGRHLRHVEREGDFYLAMSFSGIYVLVVVFDGTFDELRAERAAHDALPRIERLVEALPPIDPEPQPMGGVVSLRRGRQRR